jgi:hypothetical protein
MPYGVTGLATVFVATLVAASPAATASANAVPGAISTSAAAAVPDTAGPPAFKVVASGLNQPRRVTLGPDGTLLVSEAGLNTVPAGCKDGSQPQCVTPSGAIAEVTTGGKVTTLVKGLPSINGGKASGPGSAGPSGVAYVDGQLQFLVQDQDLNQKTGAESYGPAGQWLGTLLTAPGTGGQAKVEASLGSYEGAHNPDHGAGAKTFGEQPIDSDPFAVVSWDGGLAIADAAGNDVLFYNNGTLSTLAVLPLLPETIPANSMGKGQPPHTIVAGGQPVPDSLAVGPNGDLYIGELGGGNDVKVASVYQLTPSDQLSLYRTGFTMIGDIAFDKQGRLLVLEMSTGGLPGLGGAGVPPFGELIRVNADKSRTVLAGTGLLLPSGMTVAPDGTVYLTNLSVLQGSHDPYFPQYSGEIVRVTAANA